MDMKAVVGFTLTTPPVNGTRQFHSAVSCSARGPERTTRRAALRAAVNASAMLGVVELLHPAVNAEPEEDPVAELRIDPGENEPAITDRVYLDFRAGDAPAGRVVLGLYGDVTPATVANFLALARDGYAGTAVYRIVPGLTIQMGDVTGSGGARGRSAAPDGKPLKAENYTVSHTIPGIVSMAHDRNGDVDSRFFVTTRPGDSLYLDGRYVAFGRVVRGFENLTALERLVTTANVPKVPVVIDSCGVLPRKT